MLDAFVPKKHRRQNGDPPMTLPAVARPLDSLDVLGEDAQRYFARVEQQRISLEQTVAEVERLTRLNMRLEADLDAKDVALVAVTAERDQFQRERISSETEMHTIAELCVRWADRYVQRPAPAVDMDAMQAAVAEEPK
jgi:hypothetical protein